MFHRVIFFSQSNISYFWPQTHLKKKILLNLSFKTQITKFEIISLRQFLKFSIKQY